MADRPTLVLRTVLVATFVSSVFHYTDNYFRFDDYPQGDPELVTKPMIPISWVLFTAAGIWGYVLYRRGRYGPAAGFLAVYSISGLISPLHYTEGALSEFDTFQHVLIVTDLIAAAGVLAFAIWLLAVRRTAEAVAPEPPVSVRAPGRL